MRKGLLLALFCLITIAARCSDPDIKDYFDRPDFRQCVLLEDGNFMACNGVVVPTTPGQILMEDFEAEDELQEYYDDKETRLYFCLRYRRRCR